VSHLLDEPPLFENVNHVIHIREARLTLPPRFVI